MATMQHKQSRTRRHQRVRAKINGTSNRPRLVVFRSLKHIYAQLIDDTTAATLAAASDRDKNPQTAVPAELTNRKMIQAYQVGRLLAEKAQAKHITTIVFDRGGYRYHGRVKALADGARAGKLQF